MPASASFCAARDVGANPSTLYPSASADHGQRRRLARAGETVQTDDLLAREKNLIDGLALPGVQLRVAVLGGDARLRRN